MNIPSDLPQCSVAACGFERRIKLHRFPIQPRTDGKRVMELDPTRPEFQLLGVDATSGVVTPRGTLLDDARRPRAERDARRVAGVQQVRIAIEVAA